MKDNMTFITSQLNIETQKQKKVAEKKIFQFSFSLLQSLVNEIFLDLKLAKLRKVYFLLKCLAALSIHNFPIVKVLGSFYSFKVERGHINSFDVCRRKNPFSIRFVHILKCFLPATMFFITRCFFS